MQSIDEFLPVHDECLDACDKAFQSGDTVQLETYPSDGYFGVFGYANMDQIIEPTDRFTATQGLRQFVGALKGARHLCSNRVVRARSEYEIVVSYERIIDRGEKVLMRFLYFKHGRKYLANGGYLESW